MRLKSIISLIFCALPVWGQSIPTGTNPHAPGTEESLLIGPGDLLRIAVYDTPQLDQHPRVDDSGTIPLLFVGPLSVKGDTPAQAATAIQDRMLSVGLMRHPQVSVTVEQYATQDVAVIGQVTKPGNYDIHTSRSLLEVLSMAGGLTPLADRTVTIRRHGEAGQETAFVANAPDKNQVKDIKISPGDTIVVARMNLVYVLGDVARPGGYPIFMNDSPVTILQTLAEAGSVNKTAVISRTRLLRKVNGNYTVLPIDISAIAQGKSPDMVLTADDVLFVPFSYTKNFLLNGSAIATSVAAAAVIIP